MISDWLFMLMGIRMGSALQPQQPVEFDGAMS